MIQHLEIIRNATDTSASRRRIEFLFLICFPPSAVASLQARPVRLPLRYTEDYTAYMDNNFQTESDHPAGWLADYYTQTSPAIRSRIVEAQGTRQMQELFRKRHPRRRKPEGEDVFLQTYFELIRISRDSQPRMSTAAALRLLRTLLERLGFDTRTPQAYADFMKSPAENRILPPALSEPSAVRQEPSEDADSPLSPAATPVLLYWELRNALRRFLEVTDSDAYGKRFMGMIRLKKDEQLQHACIEVWHILNGLEKLSKGIAVEELSQPAALLSAAILDEYLAHDEGAAARMHHVMLTMKARSR